MAEVCKEDWKNGSTTFVESIKKWLKCQPLLSPTSHSVQPSENQKTRNVDNSLENWKASHEGSAKNILKKKTWSSSKILPLQLHPLLKWFMTKSWCSMSWQVWTWKKFHKIIGSCSNSPQIPCTSFGDTTTYGKSIESPLFGFSFATQKQTAGNIGCTFMCPLCWGHHSWLSEEGSHFGLPKAQKKQPFNEICARVGSFETLSASPKCLDVLIWFFH